MKFQKRELFKAKPSLIVFGLVVGAIAFVSGYNTNLAILAPEQLVEATTVATDVVCNGCIGTDDLSNSAVTTNKISNTDGVRTADIVDGQVLRADLSRSVIELNVTQVQSTVQVPPQSSALITAKCPSGMIASGGGFSGTTSRVLVVNNQPGGISSWFVQVTNLGTLEQSVTARAVCIDATMP